MASSSTSQGKGSGKKKMNIALIENRSNLQVTFSKRRTGLFKKASELCTLTGAEVAIVVFSPGGKVFSFGHPSVKNIVNRCFPEGERNDGDLMRYDGRLMEAHRAAYLEKLNGDVKSAENDLEEERKRTASIDERVKSELQWLTPNEKMTEHQVDEMSSCLLALEDAVRTIRVGMGGVLNPVQIIGTGSVSDMNNPGFELNNIDPNLMNPMGVSDMNDMGNMVYAPNMGGVNPMYDPGMNQTGELLPVPNIGYSGMNQMGELLPVPNVGYSGMNQMGELLPVPNVGYSGMNQMGELLPVPNIGYSDMNQMGEQFLIPNIGYPDITYPLMGNQSMNYMGRVEPIMGLGNTGSNMTSVQFPVSDMELPYANPYGIPVPMPDMGNPDMSPMDEVQDMDDSDFNPVDRVDMGSNLFL